MESASKYGPAIEALQRRMNFADQFHDNLQLRGKLCCQARSLKLLTHPMETSELESSSLGQFVEQWAKTHAPSAVQSRTAHASEARIANSVADVSVLLASLWQVVCGSVDLSAQIVPEALVTPQTFLAEKAAIEERRINVRLREEFVLARLATTLSAASALRAAYCDKSRQFLNSLSQRERQANHIGTSSFETEINFVATMLQMRAYLLAAWLLKLDVNLEVCRSAQIFLSECGLAVAEQGADGTASTADALATAASVDGPVTLLTALLSRDVACVRRAKYCTTEGICQEWGTPMQMSASRHLLEDIEQATTRAREAAVGSLKAACQRGGVDSDVTLGVGNISEARPGLERNGCLDLETIVSVLGTTLLHVSDRDALEQLNWVEPVLRSAMPKLPECRWASNDNVDNDGTPVNHCGVADSITQVLPTFDGCFVFRCVELAAQCAANQGDQARLLDLLEYLSSLDKTSTWNVASEALMASLRFGHTGCANAAFAVMTRVNRDGNGTLDVFDVKNRCGWNAAQVAAAGGQTNSLRWLLSQGVNLSAKGDAVKLTPAMVAAHHGHREALHFLLEQTQGSLIEALATTDDHGWSIAHFAALGGHGQLFSNIAANAVGLGEAVPNSETDKTMGLSLLVQVYAARDMCGRSPLILSAMCGHLQFIEHAIACLRNSLKSRNLVGTHCASVLRHIVLPSLSDFNEVSILQYVAPRLVSKLKGILQREIGPWSTAQPVLPPA